MKKKLYTLYKFHIHNTIKYHKTQELQKKIHINKII